jgi:hypothetical protein
VPNKPTKQERRDAAKKARAEAERVARKKRRATGLYVLLGAGGIIALIVALVLNGGGPSITVAQLNKSAEAAGCNDLLIPPDQGRGHFTKAGQTFNYNTSPPVSGMHYSIQGVAPAPTGVHTAPIQDEFQVHNLEHGHIGIQYTSALPSAIRDVLETFTRDHDTFMFMAPRDSIQGNGMLAFTAWDRLVVCSQPTSGDAVLAFAKKFDDRYEGNGPEGAIAGTPLQ